MYVVGTAGHVDHGKSTLIRALTGIDPDRLREEKTRGMTIDLGFAWLTLPSGREVSIVDVPGHERFIKNMLAGVGGIDVALMVVAADEGVMPQTREHLAILDLLRIKNGLVALTKKDLVDEEWLLLVQSDLEETLAGTVLEGAPVVAVSATTGEGVAQLAEALDRLLEDTPPRRDIGCPRLPIDRVFSIAGFGTVVTGTLVDGSLVTGQEVEILPSGLRGRIRNLQTHKHKVETALPGSRVAINLSGIAVEDIERGDVVCAPRSLQPTTALDVQLKMLRSAPKALKHGGVVNLHIGSAEVEARVSLLDKEEVEPGALAWAQLRLQAPVVAAKGDLFVLRTPNDTIAGGEIVDARPPRHRRFQASVLDSLAAAQRGSPRELVLEALSGTTPLDPATLASRASLAADATAELLRKLEAEGEVVALAGHYLAQPGWLRLREQTEATLGAYHGQFPLRRGMSKEELKSRLNLSQKVFAAVAERLAAEHAIVDDGQTLRLPAHEVTFSPEQQSKVEKLFTRLRQTLYSPPSRPELEQELGLEAEVVTALIEQGRIKRVTDSIIYPAEVYDEIVELIREHIRTHGKITVADLRDRFQTSRKYAIAMLEHLDEERVTRRVGDERVLR